ncbi:MAG TPA: branched-chain amino acid ABC transporter permease [Candidatus Acidoferrum sp.]|jgi:branched-chain amino acid transport system permease protein|nr:branched-chain amino acid ABC transporter permease [Candidatus Acidoferrum sp.]
MVEILTSQVVSGLATGCVYALIALGFVLIFKATDVVNFAQGEFVMASGFMSYTLLIGLGFPYGLVLVATIVLSGLMGVVLERVVVRPIMDAPIFSIVIATIGASIVLRSSAGIVYGYDVLPLPTIFSKDPVRVGFVRFTAMDVGVIGSSLVIMVALYLFFKLTKTGMAMRATAQSQTAARLMGVSVKRIFSLTWAISAAIGGVAGVLIAPIIYLDPNLGFIGVKAFAGAILGGFGSIPGAIVGGMLLGVIENLSGYFFNAGIKQVSTYILLILVLVIRPSGFFGAAPIRKV